MSNTADGDLKCEAALTLPKAGAGRSLEKRYCRCRYCRYCIDAQQSVIVIAWIFEGSFWYIHFIVFQSALHGTFIEWMAHCKVKGSIPVGEQKAHKRTCLALYTGNYDLYALVFNSGMYYVIPLQRNRSEPNTWTMPLIQNTAFLFYRELFFR